MIQSRCLSTQSWCALPLNQQDTVLVITTYYKLYYTDHFWKLPFLSLFQTVTGILYIRFSKNILHTHLLLSFTVLLYSYSNFLFNTGYYTMCTCICFACFLKIKEVKSNLVKNVHQWMECRRVGGRGVDRGEQ